MSATEDATRFWQQSVTTSGQPATERVQQPLAHYRVIEMRGVAPLLAGRTFADLGADVIKVEPPGGDPARRLPPLFTPEGGEPVSLVWTAYDIGKRHVTADLTTEPGRETVRRLAAEADILIEAFAPGELASMGLGREVLRASNPGLVITSLSAFGQDGPYSRWRGSDLLHFAMSGYLHMTGPADGRPIKPSVPFQTYHHAAMQAVAGTLLALRHRAITGLGTDVDQAGRDIGLWMLTHTYQYWDMQKVNLHRLGSSRDMGAFRRLRMIYACKDGHLVWIAATGHIGGASLHLLVAWMHDEGMAPDWLREIDFTEFDYVQESPETIARLEETFETFFRTKTKAQMLEWSLANRLMMAPLQNLQDVLDDPQLATRESWRSLSIPNVDKPLQFPGAPVRMTDAVWEPRLGTLANLEGAPHWLERPSPSPHPLPQGEGTKPLASHNATTKSSPEPQTPQPSPWTGRARGSAEGSLPLSGVRIIDFSTTLAGPIASRHLADFGAEVIRVESSAHLDTLRAGTPYVDNKPGPNRSGYFGAYNAGKKSIALNMTKPESRDLVRRLLANADVLLEAFVPGVMDRWGLGWKDVQPLNPRLIMASHCLQGQWGPRAKHRGYGQIAAAMTGWYDLTGLPGDDAVGPYSAYTDFICWPFLTTSILVALEVREQTGRGQHIDHAHVDTSVHFLAPLLLDLQLNGRLAQRHGNWDDYVSPNNTYRCVGDDRWLALTVATDSQWSALCRVLGHPDAATDPRFATLSARKQNEVALDDLISRWTRDADAFELAQRLQAAGIAAGPVERAEDLFADPQLQHRRFFRRLQHQELGDHAVLTASFRIAGLNPGPFTAAPLLGEHTLEVCSDILGMTPDEIAEYAAQGVFE
ncbi:MAG TPA: CoA transferase [Dehalococcoidia bacterium]|nr:CoA transferase [Dehalococcoidia bacterium]